jgi:hypothetical protein
MPSKLKPEPKPDDPDRLRQHAEAARVAEALRSRGLPVMGVDVALDMGEAIGVAFRLPNGRVTAFRHPKAEALADPGLFARDYEDACEALGREPVAEA